MDILNHDFLQFLTCAYTNKLQYLLVGGYAVNYHGYNRNTRDMDVWLNTTIDNRNSFIDTLLCMNYTKEQVAPLYNEDFAKAFKATIGPYTASIDLLTFFGITIDFDEAYSKKEIFLIDNDLPVNFVSYEILIEMKLKAQRPKDFHDIAELDRIRNPKNKK